MRKARGIPGVVPSSWTVSGKREPEYLAMEYLEGGSLKDYVKREGTVADRKALELLLPVLADCCGPPQPGYHPL